MAEPGQIILRVTCRYDGAPTEADGRYIVHYDPALTWQDSDRAYTLITSDDPQLARGFDCLADATQYVNQVCPTIPTRADGQPNRPLTAFTIEITRRSR